jgi:ribosomal protein S18 acetylase RimI-like enzyme
MPQPVNLVIRDAIPGDIPLCMALDHAYETDHVWQMTLRQDDGYLAQFRLERLPRTLEIARTPDEARLRDALAPERCFIAAVDRASQDVLGYLVMRRDPAFPIGQISDFAVDRAARRRRIGTRLLGIAAQWAKERHLSRIHVMTEITNAPAVAFLTALGYTFCGFNDRVLPNRDIAIYFSQTVR